MGMSFTPSLASNKRAYCANVKKACWYASRPSYLHCPASCGTHTTDMTVQLVLARQVQGSFNSMRGPPEAVKSKSAKQTVVI